MQWNDLFMALHKVQVLKSLTTETGQVKEINFLSRSAYHKEKIEYGSFITEFGSGGIFIKEIR